MTRIDVTLRSGEQMEITADSRSVMEALRDNGVDEVLALCGGCLSCASCHVYVREDQMSLLPPATSMEHDLLSESPHKRDNSRLSCQLNLTDDLTEIAITVAPED